MRKWVLKTVSLLMAVCLMLGVSSSALAAGWANGEASREGVIRVCQIDTDGTVIGFGTGFFVGEKGQPVEYIITNAHVAGDVVSYNEGDDAYFEKTYDRVQIVFDSLDSSTTQWADVIEVFGNVDFAILKLSSPTTLRQPLALMSSEEVEISEQVYAIGFPDVGDEDGGMDPTLREFKSTPSDTTVNMGTISNQQKVLVGDKYLQIDATINSGNSGGPLCTEEGYVVGINSMTSLYGSNMNYALYIDYAMDWLDQNGISYQKVSRADATLSAAGMEGDDASGALAADSATANVERNPIYLYAAIACAVIALATLVWIIVLKLKQKSAVASEPEEAWIPETPPADNGEWVCVSCGTMNDGMFCQRCGLRKPGAAAGEDVRFTPGDTAVPPLHSEWTCNCGQINTGRDCVRCGAARGSDGSGYKPGRGGAYRTEPTVGYSGAASGGELHKKVNTAGERPVTSYAPAELKRKVKTGGASEPPHEPDSLFKRLDSDDF